jgi:CheY-like chemotaxis protein
VPILLVEDDDTAMVVFRAAVDEADIRVEVRRVPDGEQALEFLRNPLNNRPDVVFLDLNMPKVDGWQVLLEMRADDSLCSIPAVVFSTSSSPKDKTRAFGLGARHFITTPSTFSLLVSEVQAVWKQLAPPAASAAAGLP